MAKVKRVKIGPKEWASFEFKTKRFNKRDQELTRRVVCSWVFNWVNLLLVAIAIFTLVTHQSNYFYGIFWALVGFLLQDIWSNRPVTKVVIVECLLSNGIKISRRSQEGRDCVWFIRVAKDELTTSTCYPLRQVADLLPLEPLEALLRAQDIYDAFTVYE